jgi:diphthamide biosynthesis protein 7
VSSYSNGKVAIHDVVTQGDETVQVVEKTSWVAHSLFGNTPTEVWSACFASFDNVVLSGGDDAKLKLWDVRSTTRPMQVLQHFEAGVTCISTNPKNFNICAVGSYDETLALYDVRKASVPLLHSKPLGGGIWRIKWHPHDPNRLLLAAMHGGCRVVEVREDNEFVVTKEFTKHESMAYGADWLVSHCEHDEDLVEAAASCSFYDRAVYLWDTR